PRGRPPAPDPCLTRHRERCRDLRRVGTEAEAAEPVGPARGAPDRAREEDAGEDLGTARLARRRPDRRPARHDGLAGPGAAHEGDLLAQTPDATLPRRAGRAIVLLAPADAHAEHDPARGEHVEGGDLLRDEQPA